VVPDGLFFRELGNVLVMGGIIAWDFKKKVN
jgi:hypothetical protein